MFLEKIYPTLSCLTACDTIEIACCVVIMHIMLHSIYKKYGIYWYTINYGTALCITMSWLLSYKIISTIIFIAATAKLMIQILASQHSLPPETTTHSSESHSWIETIIALSIQAFHEDISLTWIIDHKQQLHTMLNAEINLQVYIVPKLSSIILNSIDVATKTSTLWVNQHGYIIGINPYKEPSKEAPTLSDITTWSKQNGVIMIQSYAQKRTYTIAHKGMLRDNLSSHHAYHTMKHILTPQQDIRTQELV